MLRGKFMSDLADFSDDEIEMGIAEVDKQYSGKWINHADRLLFVVAHARAD